MTRRITIDLDEAPVEQLDMVYRELAHRRAPRKAAPRTHDALVGALPKLPPELADAVRADLTAGVHPLAIVDAHFGDKPALGAFAKPEIPPADPVKWFGAQALLEQAVKEMRRFTKDRRRIAAAAVELADRLALPQDEADRIIASVVSGGRRVG